MKIYEFIKIGNKKSTIKSSRVRDVKRYYISMYRSYMIYLYDHGYISDPTVFNEREIRANIVELGIKGMLSSAGKVELTSKYAEYALAKGKNSSEEVTLFLKYLYNALKYKEISDNLDKFYDSNGFNLDTKRKVGLNMAQAGAKIINKNGYKNDEGVLKCFHPYGYEFIFYSINDSIYLRALKKLGIEDTINDYSKEGFFMKELTIKEEIENCYLILNGFVSSNGKYAKVLEDWLHSNKWADNNKFDHQSEGLYNWIVKYDSEGTMGAQSELLNNLLDLGEDIMSAEENGFYVVDTTREVNFPVGQFVILSSDEEDEILPSKNNLEGYTGQVYSVGYLEQHEIDYVGCPIDLYITEKEKGLFIDMEQTEFKGQNSWFSEYGATIDFGNHEYSGSPSKNLFELEIYRFVNEAERGILIGKLGPKVKEENIEVLKKEVAKLLK